MSTVIGSVATPEASGEYPSTTCSVAGSKNVAPVSAAHTTNVTAFAEANWRSPEQLQRQHGRSGGALAECGLRACRAQSLPP
jgi:hypothetical protein